MSGFIEAEQELEQREAWYRERSEVAAQGFLLELNFSPSTNLLPIRRLNLAVGQSSHVRAAWLRFPGFTLEPLEQSYTRISDRAYRYESAGGKFVAELQMNEAGLPTRYGNIWSSEAAG